MRKICVSCIHKEVCEKWEKGIMQLTGLAPSNIEIPCKTFAALSAQGAVVAILADDALADTIAVDCRDKAHDARWCGTCESRRDAINDYRDAIDAERIRRLTSPAASVAADNKPKEN